MATLFRQDTHAPDRNQVCVPVPGLPHHILPVPTQSLSCREGVPATICYPVYPVSSIILSPCVLWLWLRVLELTSQHQESSSIVQCCWVSPRASPPRPATPSLSGFSGWSLMSRLYSYFSFSASVLATAWDTQPRASLSSCSLCH